MKAGREHRVPLSDAAVAVLKQMAAGRESEFIFPGIKAGRPLSDMAMLKVLKRMGHPDLTTHGFRSSFRDWSGERAELEGAREAAEAALAHVVKDKSERAYARSDLFDKRKVLMGMWAQFCTAVQIAEFVMQIPFFQGLSYAQSVSRDSLTPADDIAGVLLFA
jgi:integrase